MKCIKPIVYCFHGIYNPVGKITIKYCNIPLKIKINQLVLKVIQRSYNERHDGDSAAT